MKKYKILTISILLLILTTFIIVSCSNKNIKEKESYSLEKNQITIEVNKSKKLEVYKIKNNEKIVFDNRKVEWKSKNENIATVSEDGEIKALKNGKTVIIGKIKDFQYDLVCEIIVGKLRLKNNSITLTTNKKDVKFDVFFGEEKLSNEDINIKSLNTDILEINNNKLVPIKTGKTKISIKYLDYEIKSDVNIINNIEGHFYSKVIVPEMDNSVFEFDLIINKDNTFKFSIRESNNEFLGHKKAEDLYNGQISYTNYGSIQLTYETDGKIFDSYIEILDENSLVTVEKLRIINDMEASLKFDRV